MNDPETENALKEYKKLRDYLKSLNFDDCDIRLEYFQLMSSIYDRFHKGFATLDFLKRIADEKLLDDIVMPNESFRFIFNDYWDKPHREAYFSDSTRRFIIDSWSVFELIVTQILDNLLDRDVKEIFLNKEYNEVKSILDLEIKSESQKKKIYKLLKEGNFTKSNLTHQSINRRYDKLFSIIKDKYNRDIESDKKLLRFLGVYRNGLHYNFVFYGNNFDYSFENLFFKFINGDTILTPNEPWAIRIINELIEIVKGIFACIDMTYIKSNINYDTY